MMNSRKMTRAMIETAVNKGLQDIEEDLHRGVRNLVDLGTHFAKGRFQKDFFRFAQQLLLNEKSPYYEIVTNLVHNVDHQILKTLGINLGYNSWTFGANKIREYEKGYGYNIPWTIVFDFCQETETILSEKELSKILDSGETMGIYCGIFFLDNRSSWDMLISVLTSHSESIYILFAPPEIITNQAAAAIAKAGNITIALKVKAFEKKIESKKAAEILQNNKCLYGAYSLYDDHNIQYIMSAPYARQIEDLHCTYTFLIRETLEEAKNKETFAQFMQTAKSANSNRFLLIDFYEDLAYVDRTISVEDCFLSIKADGQIAITSSEKLVHELNVQTDSLCNILEKTMPRIQYL